MFSPNSVMAKTVSKVGPDAIASFNLEVCIRRNDGLVLRRKIAVADLLMMEKLMQLLQSQHFYRFVSSR